MILIVTGYGPDITPEMQKRLRKTADFCNQNHPETIVFTGGHTKKSVPVSEARAMANFLRPLLDYEPIVLLEEESHTTVENIINSTKMVGWQVQTFLTPFLSEDRDMKRHKVVIDCEETRVVSIFILGIIYIGAVPRIVSHRWMSKWLGLHSLASTVLTMILITIPGTLNMMRKSRLARAARN